MMELLSARDVTNDELETIDSAIASMPANSPLADALQRVSSGVRSGHDVLVAATGEELTPAQAAKLLKLSRTHLYKLLDGGAIPFGRVGRDRRLKVADVFAYENERQAQRTELAERFAHTDRNRSSIIGAFGAADAQARLAQIDAMIPLDS